MVEKKPFILGEHTGVSVALLVAVVYAAWRLSAIEARTENIQYMIEAAISKELSPLSLRLGKVEAIIEQMDSGLKLLLQEEMKALHGGQSK